MAINDEDREFYHRLAPMAGRLSGPNYTQQVKRAMSEYQMQATKRGMETVAFKPDAATPHLTMACPHNDYTLCAEWDQRAHLVKETVLVGNTTSEMDYRRKEA